MKIIITENKFKAGIKSMIADLGVKSSIDFSGGWTNFCKVMNIKSPMDFLHLFDDLEQVQSEEREHMILFRYKKGYNYMVYDKEDGEVHINHKEIWSFLEDKFDLTYPVVQGITKKWLGEVYNFRKITTNRVFWFEHNLLV